MILPAMKTLRDTSNNVQQIPDDYIQLLIKKAAEEESEVVKGHLEKLLQDRAKTAEAIQVAFTADTNLDQQLREKNRKAERVAAEVSGGGRRSGN